MIVLVIDRDAQIREWNDGHARCVCTYVRSIEIGDTCPTCCGPRGPIERRPFTEDGEHYEVDCWTNPCGHVDTYRECIAEAAARRNHPSQER